MTGNRWIIVFLALLYSYYFFVIASIQLIPDEAYYWNWSKHLDWSYFDHPPFVAYIMYFFTRIGGDSEFFVRIGGLLCTIVTILLTAMTTRTLFPEEDNRLSWEIPFIFSLTLIFTATALILTPDTPMILFWILAVYFGSRIITGEEAKWWYGWGTAVGLGLQSKYTMILIVPCQFAYLLFSRRHRFWLLRKEPYLALLLGLIIFSPVIVWNWQHNWVSFAFQLHQGLTPDKGKDLIYKLLNYAGGQAGVITPGLFAAFIFYGAMGFYFSLKNDDPSYRYLFILSWPVLIFFGYTTFRGETAEANWPAPAYLTGLILMWVVYHRHYRTRKRHRIFVHAGIILAFVINLTVQIHLHYPIVPIPAKNDIIKRFHSWRDLGEKINDNILKHPQPNGYFLVSDKGTTLAEALFYTGNQYIGIDFSMPERYLFLNKLDALQGKNAILIFHKNSPEALKKYRKYFRNIRSIDSHKHIYRNEEIKRLSTSLFLGSSYLGGWNP